MGVQLNKVRFEHGLNAHRDQFISNIRENTARVAAGEVREFKTRRAILVAGGPSANDHVDEIKDRARSCDVWCVNGAHDWLRCKGIRPTVCVMMDANAIVDRFVAKPLAGVRYMLASQAHPSLVDRFERGGYDVMIWHAALDAEAHAVMGDATITAPANTVGLHALQLMCLSGVRHCTIYGMDSSHRPGADHAYDNRHQHANDEVEFVYGGKSYMATGTWAAQAEMFRKMYPKFFYAGMRIDVVGDGLLPAMWADAHNAVLAKLMRGVDDAE